MTKRAVGHKNLVSAALRGVFFPKYGGNGGLPTTLGRDFYRFAPYFRIRRDAPLEKTERIRQQGVPTRAA